MCRLPELLGSQSWHLHSHTPQRAGNPGVQISTPPLPILLQLRLPPNPLTPGWVLPLVTQDRKAGRRFQSFAKTYQFYLLQTASLFLVSPSSHCPCSGHCQGVSIGVSASTSAPDFRISPKGTSTNAVEHIASCLGYAKNSHHRRTTSRVLGRVRGALISDLSCPPIVASCYSLRAPPEQPVLECAGLWHPEPWHRALCPSG